MKFITFNIFLSELLIFSFGLSRDELKVEEARAVPSSTPIERPTIYPNSNEITVFGGTNLTLGCVGKQPIIWENPDQKIPHYLRAERNFTVKYENLTDNAGNFIFGALLIVTNVSSADVGFYSCYVSEIENQYTWQHIYVNVEDEKRLSVYDGILTDVYLPSITNIPCVPTTSDVNVTLYYTLNGSMVPSNLYTYDYHFGYEMDFNFKMDHILFSCRFTKKGFENETKLHYFEAHELRMPSLPYINSQVYIEKQIGEDLILNCTVVRNFWEIAFKLNWKFNETFLQNKPNRIIISNKFIPFITGRVYISTLLIKKVEYEDEGTYKCIGSDRIQREKNTEVFLVVSDNSKKNEIFIYPNKDKIQIESGKNVTFYCQGKQPINWKCVHNDIKNTISTQNSTIQNNKIIYYASLLLTNVTTKNVGFYYCYFEKYQPKNSFKSKSLYLLVQDETVLFVFPRGNLISNQESHKMLLNPTDKQIIIKTKKFKFFLPCLPTSNKVTTNFLQKDNEENFYKPLRFDPRFGIELLRFGEGSVYVTCRFVYNNLTDFLYFRIESKGEKFTPTYIRSSTKSYNYLSGHLTLTCSIIFHDYFSSNLHLNWINPKNEVINSEQFSMMTNEGKFVVSTLIIPSLTYEDEGKYICCTVNNTDDLEDDEYLEIHIKIFEKFKTKLKLEEEVYIGQNIQIECFVNIDHNIDFDIEWILPKTIKEERIKISTTKYKPNVYEIIGVKTLQIYNISKKDIANYTCRVRDDFYSSNATEFIPIYDPKQPQMLKSNLNRSKIEKQEGDLVSWYCIPEGLPIPKVIWYKDGQVIDFNRTNAKLSENGTVLIIPYIFSNNAGVYKCNISNFLGWVQNEVELLIIKDYFRRNILIGLAIFLTFLTSIPAILLIVKFRQQKKLREMLKNAGLAHFIEGDIPIFNPDLNITLQADLLPYNQQWEILKQNIKIGEELGSGYFGLVMKGELKGDNESKSTVAIKMVRAKSDFVALKSLISELKIMSHMGKHLNIVNLIGACTENVANGELLVVVEFCKVGNLRSYLITNREEFKKNLESEEIKSDDGNLLTSNSYDDLVSWAFQVGRGMEYLASLKILHGDLAARNVLLTDKNIVKICDFGLSKSLYKNNVYKKKNKCPLPIRWMAIESIREKVFSIESDVWSYGIFLWELFSLGTTPYPELETNLEFYRKLQNGYRMKQPIYSTKQIYQIMLDCWNTKPNLRPTFLNLVEFFQNITNKKFLENYNLILQQQSENYNLKSFDCDYLRRLNSSDFASFTTSNLNNEDLFVENNVTLEMEAYNF